MTEQSPQAEVASEIDRLAARTRARLRGRVTGLRIEVRDGGVVLHGTAGSFYAKQLAQHAVMTGTGLRIMRNEIKVTRGEGEPAGVRGGPRP